MKSNQFKIKRADGRSDAQVLIDNTKNLNPGDKVSFDEIIRWLENGCTKEYTIPDARGVVYRAEHRLLSEQSRAFINVRGYGYKIAHAAEHSMIARNRKEKSDILLKKGMHTLKNVRWDEMDANQKAAHEGTILVIGALMAAQDSMKERQDRMEDLLKKAISK